MVADMVTARSGVMVPVPEAMAMAAKAIMGMVLVMVVLKAQAVILMLTCRWQHYVLKKTLMMFCLGLLFL